MAKEQQRRQVRSKTVRKVRRTRLYLGRLPHGGDLLDDLTAFCRRKRVFLGRVETLGAVSAARVGFYDQGSKKYRYRSFAQPMEILNLVGNISRRDGEPMVHAHVTLADEKGRAVGGHLASGTVVFACEFLIEAFDGPAFRRRPDPTTGLPLWVFSRGNTG